MVFGLRGFCHTYNLHESDDDLKSIVIRHDVSGRYPYTESHSNDEREVMALARKPLDGLHEFIYTGFPDIEDDGERMEIDS